MESDDPERGAQTDDQVPVGRLISWKEIASYLDRNERTARRWEKTEGLPIHRHPHAQRDSVYAFKAELDQWLHAKGRHPADDRPNAVIPSSDRLPRRWRMAGASAAIVAAIAVGFSNMAFSPGESRVSLRTTPLTSYPGWEQYSSFSPDGSQFAFSWKREDTGNFDVYVRLTEGGTPQSRTSDLADDLSPVWSPDGRWIAFVRLLPDLTAAILAVPAPGGPEKQLALTPIVPANAIRLGYDIAWSPDGKWIVYPDRKLGVRGFAIVSVETGEKRWLLAPALGAGPAFSPDGRRFAYAGYHSFTASEIHVSDLRADFSLEHEPRRITFEARLSISPVWAAVGGRLRFLSGHYGAEMTLYEINAAGDEAAKAIGSAGDEAFLLSPVPTARGARPWRIAYTRNFFDPDILQIELKGKEALSRRIMVSSTRIDFNPQFSPDGTRLTFESNRSGTMEIWKCDRNGSNPVPLTSFGGPLTGAARWSPDGGLIVFNSRQGGNSDLFVIAAEGGQPRRLTNDPSNEELSSWSTDGHWIYFTSDRTGRSEVWRMPSAGGAAVQVTKRGGFSPLESPDGKFLYFAKGRATGPASLWRIPRPGLGGASEETQVLDSLSDWSTYVPANDGIWFVPADGKSVRFLSYGTGQAKVVTNLEKPAIVGLNVSGTTLLVSQVNSGSDLMLMEYLQSETFATRAWSALGLSRPARRE